MAEPRLPKKARGWARGSLRACLALAALVATIAAGSIRAQPLPASLVADLVTYDDATGILIAAGNVEVFYQGRVLRAERILYDERADEIRASGPLVLTDPVQGVVLADAATLSPDLREGLIAGARLLVANQLQLAAAEVRRTDGRYTTLYRTIGSSCTICAGSSTPTWALRASRITQDAVARRIYFENATVEAFGLPIAFLPRLSVPDPSVGRASGVLVPRALQSNIYGFGIKLPYYRVLSPSSDMTLTPFVTTGGAQLVEGEYRRRFSNGGFDVSGVLAIDDGLGGDFGRGTFAARGAFALARGFTGRFDVNLASDDSFLQQFDYSDEDLLTSTVRVLRTRESDFLELGAIAFQSLRAGENTGSVPLVLPEFTYYRLIETPRIGGRLEIAAQSLGLLRNDGEDVFHSGGSADWRRGWTTPAGILADATLRADLDFYRLAGQDEQGQLLTRASPTVGLDLRWPFARQGEQATHVIEPITQIYYSETLGDTDVPNEDSRLPEFDETNLFAINRFPGDDRIETGLRANVGLRYTRFDPAGWTLGLTLGRVLRAEPEDAFSAGSGLRGQYSDYVGALSLEVAPGLRLIDRALFDPDLDFKRNEFALAYFAADAEFEARYVYLAADRSSDLLGSQDETSEIGLEGRYRLHPNWEVRGNWRYDIADDSAIRAGGGLAYGNECAEFDLSVSRRYTLSDNVPPSTSFGFNVRLAGFGGPDAQEPDWPARRCVARGL